MFSRSLADAGFIPMALHHQFGSPSNRPVWASHNGNIHCELRPLFLSGARELCSLTVLDFTFWIKRWSLQAFFLFEIFMFSHLGSRVRSSSRSLLRSTVLTEPRERKQKKHFWPAIVQACCHLHLLLLQTMPRPLRRSERERIGSDQCLKFFLPFLYCFKHSRSRARSSPKTALEDELRRERKKKKRKEKHSKQSFPRSS